MVRPINVTSFMKAKWRGRVIDAMRNPFYKIWGHPSGRLVQRRPPITARMEEILDVIAERGAAIEISGDPYRLDMEPRWTVEARSAASNSSFQPMLILFPTWGIFVSE